MLFPSVGLREAGLNALFGTWGSQVLNPEYASGGKIRFGEISRSLARALLTFKSEVMDERGTKIEYVSLQTSEIYLHYKKVVAPQFQQIDLSTISPPEEQLAFWINLYNSLTIDAVISFGISKSVTEGWFGMIRFFRRAAYNIGGSRFSLEDIEHGILRANKGHSYFPGPHFSDGDPRKANVIEKLNPRIHFALNCASRSCPPIGIYTGEKLDQELKLATHNFILEETKLSEGGRHLITSSLFKWYWRDFGGLAGLRMLFQEALPQNDERYMLLAQANGNPFRFSPYKWELNI
jgi:hypothetical protein